MLQIQVGLIIRLRIDPLAGDGHLMMPPIVAVTQKTYSFPHQNRRRLRGSAAPSADNRTQYSSTGEADAAMDCRQL